MFRIDSHKCGIRMLGSVLLFLLLAVCGSAASGDNGTDTYVIGVLNQAWAANHPAVAGLKDGLRERGFDEGRRVTFDIRFTKGDPTLTAEAAAQLADADVDLIFTCNEVATKAALEVTQRIPIVFTLVGDPVASGIVSNMSQPGGNVTGISGLSTELVVKRLEFMKALLPSLSRVSAIYYAYDPSSLAALQRAREAAANLGLEIVPHAVRSSEELESVLGAIPAGDALLPPPTDTLDIPAKVLDLARSAGRPTVFGSAIWVRYGALLAYGSDYYAEGRQAARLVARILRGARPQDLPVEAANKIELAVNIKMAKFLDITVPRSVLFRADKVVQ